MQRKHINDWEYESISIDILINERLRLVDEHFVVARLVWMTILASFARPCLKRCVSQEFTYYLKYYHNLMIIAIETLERENKKKAIKRQRCLYILKVH